jgi:hypothetical protein
MAIDPQTTDPIDILAVACGRQQAASDRLYLLRQMHAEVVSDFDMQMAVIAYATSKEDVLIATRVAVELQEYANAV